MSNQTEDLFKKIYSNETQNNEIGRKRWWNFFLFLAAVFKIEWTRVTFKFRLYEKIVLFNSELNLRFTMTDQNLTMSNNQFAKPMDWIKKILKEYLKNEKIGFSCLYRKSKYIRILLLVSFSFFLTGTDQILMEFCLESWSHQRFSIFWQLYSFERWTNPPFQTLQ